MSAKLKTGKSQIAIKSLTQPSKSLSIRFQIVQDIKREKSNLVSSFLEYKKINKAEQKIAMMIEIIHGTGIDRDIQVFKIGWNSGKWEKLCKL